MLTDQYLEKVIEIFASLITVIKVEHLRLVFLLVTTDKAQINILIAKKVINYSQGRPIALNLNHWSTKFSGLSTDYFCQIILRK
jgi:hypothetical protein